MLAVAHPTCRASTSLKSSVSVSSADCTTQYPKSTQARQRCAGSDVGEQKLILAVQHTKALMSGNNPSTAAEPALPPKKPCPNLRYVSYGTEKESPFLPAIRQLISNDLSEPYSIYVYRYFLYQWGHLCFMALDDDDNLIGVIVCKLEPHRGGPMRGYIAMLATRKDYRGHGIATSLVNMAIEKMISEDADEIALETEVDNIPSLRIYENLGFIRTKRLHRYYLNGNTAFRLILYLKPGIPWRPTYPPDYPMPMSDPAAMQGRGLMGEDLFARQATQMQIEDVHGEQFDIMKAAKSDDF